MAVVHRNLNMDSSTLSTTVSNSCLETSLLLKEVAEAAEFVASKVRHQAQIAVICGSGMSHLADTLTDADHVEYKDIPYFACPTVQGHSGRIVCGLLKEVPVLLMLGRVHVYEGCSMWKVTFGVRVLGQMGIKALLVTNAAGAINQTFRIGDLMIIKDHVNLAGLTGLNPLLGLNDDRFGPRFLNISAPYDREFRSVARRTAADLGLDFVREGVHFVQVGPCYETTAECRMLDRLGADTVGMSTAPEVIVARQLGIRCFGLTMVTNICNLDFDVESDVNHKEVLEAGKNRAKGLQDFCSALVLEFHKVLSNQP